MIAALRYYGMAGRMLLDNSWEQWIRFMRGMIGGNRPGAHSYGDELFRAQLRNTIAYEEQTRRLVVDTEMATNSLLQSVYDSYAGGFPYDASPRAPRTRTAREQARARMLSSGPLSPAGSSVQSSRAPSPALEETAPTLEAESTATTATAAQEAAPTTGAETIAATTEVAHHETAAPTIEVPPTDGVEPTATAATEGAHTAS